MASQPPDKLYSLFGFVIWGDFGPLTMYHRADGRLVVMLKTWPDKPPSPAQLTQRAVFAAAATTWNALSTAQRLQWSTAAARASLCATGYNLWVHWQITGDQAAIATIERQTRTTLLP